MANSLAVANFIVQVAILAALLKYTIETLKIRKAAQEQSEGVQKPCLTLLSEARNYEDAVLAMHGAVGGMNVAARDGNVVVHNIGNGPAINIRYDLTPVNLRPGQNAAHPTGYLQNISAGEMFTMPVARGVLATLEYRIQLTYDSMTGQKYTSTLTVDNFVLTHFAFAKEQR